MTEQHGADRDPAKGEADPGRSARQGGEASAPAAAPAEQGSEKIEVAPRAVGAAGGIFGVSCLTALAVVAGLTDADALATVALALAILAFVIQILVFIAQANASNHQMLRSEQLNTQTRGLLTEMQATARLTHDMVGEQFGQLLRAFMDAVKAAERKGGFDQGAFTEQLARSFQSEQRPPSPSPPAVERALSVNNDHSYDAGPFPAREEVASILGALEELSAQERKRLQTYGSDKHAIAEGATGYEGYPPGYDPRDKELADKGWLDLLRTSSEDGPRDGLVYRLNDRGETAARLLNCSGPIPDWALPIVV